MIDPRAEFIRRVEILHESHPKRIHTTEQVPRRQPLLVPFRMTATSRSRHGVDRLAEVELGEHVHVEVGTSGEAGDDRNGQCEWRSVSSVGRWY